MAHYYLAAQLPYLIYGQPAPMTSEDYIARCQDLMSASDFALLALCTLDPDPLEPDASSDTQKMAYTDPIKSSRSDFIDKWRNWERVLRLNLARFRSNRLKREWGSLLDPPDSPADAVNAAKAAAGMDSPLEAELYLDKARWEAIEGFQGLSYFNVNTIYAYLLKLRLLERRALFKAEEGFAEYKELYTAIVGASASSEGRASNRDESGDPK